MTRYNKIANLVFVVTLVTFLAPGQGAQKKPEVKTRIPDPNSTCKVERKDKFVEITCADGWAGQIIAADKDRVWFKSKGQGQAKPQLKLVERVSNGKLALIPTDRRKECATPRDVCACIRLGDTVQWCDLPPCCPGPKCPSDEEQSGSDCNIPGPASFDFCAFVSGGCNDTFTRAVGISSYFCAGRALGCN